MLKFGEIVSTEKITAERGISPQFKFLFRLARPLAGEFGRHAQNRMTDAWKDFQPCADNVRRLRIHCRRADGAIDNQVVRAVP